eukprot:NODE_203_length_12996_cov_1.033961.p4 type:complete len:379 gc:universal NODE_203_length_12996_cov_1.033961:8108-9244(+)
MGKENFDKGFGTNDSFNRSPYPKRIRKKRDLSFAEEKTRETMNLKILSKTHAEIKNHKMKPFKLSQIEIKQLKEVVFGSHKRSIPASWKNKGFEINRYCTFGFMQKRGGPCTVLASINAFLIKHLLFSEFQDFDCLVEESIPLLKPSEEQVYRAFSYALTEILWKCASNTRVVKLCVFNDTQTEISKCDGITEYMQIFQFKCKDNLEEMRDCANFIFDNIEIFKGNTIRNSSHAILATLYSCILTRGFDQIMRDVSCNLPLIDNDENAFGSQSVVNLMLVGEAIIDTLDHEQASIIGMQGIKYRSEIGFMTPIAEMVGNRLMNPKHPIWILHFDSHYTVMFKPSSNSNVYTYYDMLALKNSLYYFELKDGGILFLFRG